jgi:hypothetical protein
VQDAGRHPLETFPRRLTAKPASAITQLPNKGRAAGSGVAKVSENSGILEALVRANQRGVDVRLIVDKATPCGSPACLRWGLG